MPSQANPRQQGFHGKSRQGKTSTGWCYGLKLFLVINAFGEIMNAFFTPGNVADNHLATMIKLFSKLKGWALADKGFINQKAREELLSNSLHFITGIRKNMKNKLLGVEQKLLLQKRGVVESINDILKTVCDIKPTRHRSPVRCISKLICRLVQLYLFRQAAFYILKPKTHVNFNQRCDDEA